MTDTVLRGRLLSFHREPDGPQDTEAFSYIQDGAIVVRDGMIVASGDYRAVRPKAGTAVEIDHLPNLLMAGFVDAHIHFPPKLNAEMPSTRAPWLLSFVRF